MSDHETPAPPPAPSAPTPEERIEGALRRLGAEHEPPAGWEARVLAATARARAHTHRPRSRFDAPVAGFFAMAAAMSAVAAWPASTPTFTLTLTAEAMRGATPKAPRAHPTDAQLYDTLDARAEGGEFAAVWVYVDDALLVACTRDAPDPRCPRVSGGVAASIVPKVLGLYTFAAISSEVAVLPSTKDRRRDLADARRRGAIIDLQFVLVD